MSDTDKPPSVETVIAALHGSHDRMAGLLASLPDEQVESPSYDEEWSIAQVASHLGSGAEVFDLFLDAGIDHAAAPGVEEFQPIWDRWNAKPAISQTRDAVRADKAFLDRLDDLSEQQRQAWRLDLFDITHDLAGVLRLRLTEHALHTWDIAVALDPTVTVADDAVELVIDHLATLVERAAKPAPSTTTVDVRTTTPTRRFRLELSPSGARLTPAAEPATPANEPATASTASMAVESVQTLANGTQAEAIGHMLVRLPPCPDAQRHTTLADVVDSAGDLCQDCGRSIGGAGDE